MRSSPTPLTPLLAYLLLSTSGRVLASSSATDDFSSVPGADFNPASSDMSANLFAAAQGRAAFLSAAELVTTSELQNRTLFGGSGGWTPSSLRRYAGDVYPERRTCKKKNNPSSSSHGSGQGGDNSSSSSSSGSSTPGSSGTGNSGGSSTGNAGHGSSTPNSPWKLATQYQGDTFFDGWNFWNAPDPTHGLVDYQSKQDAMSKGLAYVDGQGNAIMQVDSWTDLDKGVGRPSVRIHSQKTYDEGLVIADVNSMPFGCGLWPALWMNGPNWPAGGEIDIIEGVNDGAVNQYTLHTSNGCSLDPSANFTGKQLSTDCYALAHKNAGCAIKDANLHGPSYGSALNQHGGGVFATQFDQQDGIAIWFFPRNMIPDDVTASKPNPQNWLANGLLPSAWYKSGGSCDYSKFFYQQILIVNIVVCGDWAGGVYAQSGCPGTCSEQAMKGANFQDAVWNISSIKVYQRSS